MLCYSILMTPTLDWISSMSHFPQSSGPYKRGRTTKKAKSVTINHGTRPPPSLIQNRLVPCRAATSTNPGKQKLAEEWLIRLKTYQMFASRGFCKISWVHWCYQRVGPQVNLSKFCGKFRIFNPALNIFQKSPCTHHLVSVDLPPLPIQAFSFQGIGQASDAITWMGARGEMNKAGSPTFIKSASSRLIHRSSKSNCTSTLY